MVEKRASEGANLDVKLVRDYIAAHGLDPVPRRDAPPVQEANGKRVVMVEAYHWGYVCHASDKGSGRGYTWIEVEGEADPSGPPPWAMDLRDLVPKPAPAILVPPPATQARRGGPSPARAPIGGQASTPATPVDTSLFAAEYIRKLAQRGGWDIAETEASARVGEAYSRDKLATSSTLTMFVRSPTGVGKNIVTIYPMKRTPHIINVVLPFDDLEAVAADCGEGIEVVRWSNGGRPLTCIRSVEEHTMSHTVNACLKAHARHQS